ncbi:hypothetical protein ACOMHN_034192 [Nucella lapillus]
MPSLSVVVKCPMSACLLCVGQLVEEHSESRVEDTVWSLSLYDADEVRTPFVEAQNKDKTGGNGSEKFCPDLCTLAPRCPHPASCGDLRGWLATGDFCPLPPVSASTLSKHRSESLPPPQPGLL